MPKLSNANTLALILATWVATLIGVSGSANAARRELLPDGMTYDRFVDPINGSSVDKLRIDPRLKEKRKDVVIFIINGNGGCAPCILTDDIYSAKGQDRPAWDLFPGKLDKLGVDYYFFDWNDAMRRKAIVGSDLNDSLLL